MSKPERWNHWRVEHLPCKFDNDDDHETYPVVSVPSGNPCGHPDHRHHWRPPASSVYVSSGEQEQDAQLMASAPELLKKKEQFLEFVKRIADVAYESADWIDDFEEEDSLSEKLELLYKDAMDIIREEDEENWCTRIGMSFEKAEEVGWVGPDKLEGKHINYGGE